MAQGRSRLAAPLILGFFVLGGSRTPASAKVVFTGYGDFQAAAQSHFRILGPDNVLSSLGAGQGEIEGRGATIDSLGLFATTQMTDATRLAMDVTYRDIGNNTKTLRVQYAYIEHQAYGGQVRAGKILLPFGYYNENRFYPFQRPSISAPFFQSSILGLPISDIGASANKTFELGDATLRADVYGVNGFGPVPGSSQTFRNASVAGGLVLANNVTSVDTNHRVALGGRLELGGKNLGDSVVGVSYYRDQWRPDGGGLFQMAGAHVHAAARGFDLLVEYLMLIANGDLGMVANFGSRDWRTNGAFATLEYDRWSVLEHRVTPWVRCEEYLTHGGGGGREAARELAGGFSVQANEYVAIKLEADDLYYRLPYQDKGDVKLIGYEINSGLAVTF